MNTQLAVTYGRTDIQAGKSTWKSFSIGRSAKNDLQLLDPNVSRYHCRIDKTDDGLLLSDLQSKNGSFVNGLRCRTIQLKEGDILQIGNSTFNLSPALQPMQNLQETTQDFLPFNETPQSITGTTDIAGRNKPTQQQIAPFGELRNPISAEFPGRTEKTPAESFMQKTRIYMLATIILCSPVLFLAGNRFVESNDIRDADIAANAPTDSLNTPADTDEDSPPLSTESSSETNRNTEKANELSREADIIFETGDYSQSMKMFQTALNLDPDNILAKLGMKKVEKYIDDLAQICFSRGENHLRAFNYKLAVKEFETVVSLLDNRPEHKLYLEAGKLIKQSQLNVTN